MMTPASWIVLAIAALWTSESAAETRLVYKEGATIVQQQRAQQACSAIAEQAAPVHVIVEGRLEYRPSENRYLRQRVRDLCLKDRGYVYVRLPSCQWNVRQAVQRNPTRVFPPLAETTCIIRYDDGTFQIVTPRRNR